MRKRLFCIIDTADDNDTLSKIYDVFMMIVIFVSILPLAFKHHITIFIYIDKIAVVIFIIDYILRWITSDLKLNKGKTSFLIYPFTMMALIDLISILPSLSFLNNGFKLFKLVRLMRTLRVLRVFRTLRYSKSIILICKVFKKEKEALVVVLWLAIGFILISALVIFNVEPQTFETFFDAVYWSVVSLTTMGYGDIYPVSSSGRIITMLSAVLGIAIIALPASIITAGYMDELKKENR